MSKHYRKMVVLTGRDGKKTREYDKIGGFTEDGIAVVFRKEEGYGYINRNLEEICPLKYDMAFDFVNGFGCVKLFGKYGFVDTDGNEICPIKYKNAWAFSGVGIARVDMANQKGGFINTCGEELFEPKYTICGYNGGSAKDTSGHMHEFTGFNHQGLAIIIDSNKYGLIDEFGNVVVEPKYSNIILPREDEWDYIPYSDSFEGKYKMGYLDRHGNIVLFADHYDKVTTFRNGFAIVTIDNKEGIIDLDFLEVSPARYNAILPFSKDGCAYAIKIVRMGPFEFERKGYIDMNGTFSRKKP